MKLETDQLLTLPVLPLRDVVVYPHMVIPLFVGRKKSISCLEAAMEQGKKVLLVAQTEASLDDPKIDDLYKNYDTASVVDTKIENAKTDIRTWLQNL